MAISMIKKSDDTHFMDMYGYFWASMNISRDQWISMDMYKKILIYFMDIYSHGISGYLPGSWHLPDPLQ